MVAMLATAIWSDSNHDLVGLQFRSDHGWIPTRSRLNSSRIAVGFRSNRSRVLARSWSKSQLNFGQIMAEIIAGFQSDRGRNHSWIPTGSQSKSDRTMTMLSKSRAKKNTIHSQSRMCTQGSVAQDINPFSYRLFAKSFFKSNSMVFFSVILGSS